MGLPCMVVQAVTKRQFLLSYWCLFFSDRSTFLPYSIPAFYFYLPEAHNAVSLVLLLVFLVVCMPHMLYLTPFLAPCCGPAALRWKPALPCSSALGISRFLLGASQCSWHSPIYTLEAGGCYQAIGDPYPVGKRGLEAGVPLPLPLRSIILRHGLYHFSEGQSRCELQVPTERPV